MSRCLRTTLPISRFPLASLAAWVAVAVAVPLTAFAQDTPVAPPSAVSDAVARADAPDGASGSASDNDFDVRQKALDRRSAENDYQYGVAEHNCYSKFLVNYCLGKARDNQREVRAQIRKEQLALDDERRAARAQQRDEQAVVKRAQDEASAPARAATDVRNAQSFEDKQRQHELDQAKRNAEAPQRAANQRAYDQKQADFQRKLDQAHQQAAQKAQERAQNAQRYQQKQVDAAQHKADVETRQKQAAQKAQQKQQEQLREQQQQQGQQQSQ
jgi:hypothetical protein